VVQKMRISQTYLPLFVAVFSGQIGIPVPSLAFLVAAAAMVASHQMELPAAMAGSAVACILADCLWFSLGRKRGYRGLTFACKLAVNPEAFAARAVQTASRYWARISQQAAAS
jgi:membrane protein DedA with SNARE-associated domain